MVLNVFIGVLLCNLLLWILALNLLHCDVKSSRVLCDATSQSDVKCKVLFSISPYSFTSFLGLEVHFWAHGGVKKEQENMHCMESALCLKLWLEFDQCVLTWRRLLDRFVLCESLMLNNFNKSHLPPQQHLCLCLLSLTFTHRLAGSIRENQINTQQKRL